MSRRFSAPGKLVFVGEYAVVDGEPAVVAAVDRRALCTVDDAGDLRVRGNDPRWLAVTAAVLDDATPLASTEQPLLVAVLREVRRRGIPLPAVHAAVSTTSFHADAASGHHKLGLGSSAAAAVALTAAFVLERATDGGRGQVHDVARAAHRAFQGGGSGIDVAASTYGGVCRFQAGVATAAPGLPAALELVVASTGRAAHTQGFVDAYRALPDRAAHRAALSAATARFLDGCATNDARDVLGAVDDARSAMDALGRAAGTDVVTAEHAAIAALAREHGGAAKPSGAGGGDIAVCFVPCDARPHLENALAAAGFPVVRLRIGAPGVQIDA